MATGSMYLTKARFKLLAYALPSTRIDECDLLYPGFIDSQIEILGAEVEDRLRHKYVIPFPEGSLTVQGWIAGKLQLRVLTRIGVDPSDLLFVEVQRLATQVDTDLGEAADTQSSRQWNLPLVTAGDTSNVSKGGPFSYAEASPYAWLDAQSEALL